MHTGEVIKYLRKQMNLTQQELADLLGVKKASIKKYESGSVQNLKLETIQKLCKIFQEAPFAFIFPELWKEANLTKGNEKEIDAWVLHYLKLTKEGKRKVHEYVKDLSELKKYCSEDRNNEELFWFSPNKNAK